MPPPGLSDDSQAVKPSTKAPLASAIAGERHTAMRFLTLCHTI
ncbi:hypothetical protein SAMN06265355_10458 [Actinomadura mexicana]|uniref:Uncharacterized protein n=1 Tax=Actinomadura mexicana TaxID=134959 RepID=A0A238X7S6_9ACTN|nr:hypothetical protein SAMN06265355_10458 [Actinomadura mexicana]